MTKRLVIFFFFDKEGIVDDYVPHLLTALRPFVSKLLFVSNGALTGASETIARSVSDDLLIRSNIGFDVWAYKEAIEHIGYDEIGRYDELILMNHTFYGPLFPLSEMFDEMERRSDDFWGISIHKALTPNPLTGIGTMPAHIQSHFIAVRKRMLGATAFRDYWQFMDKIGSYNDSVQKHESRFTHHFASLGFSHSAYIDPEQFDSPYPIFIEVDRSLELRTPILKRRLFFHDTSFHQNAGIDLPRTLERLAEVSDYDPSLIWKNIVREAKPRTLLTNSGHLRILDDRAAKSGPSPLRVAICAHIRKIESLEPLVRHTAMFPDSTDLIVTTETEELRKAAGELLNRDGWRGHVEIRATPEDHGYGAAALILGCGDLLLDEKYDLVCRLQDSFTEFDLGLPTAYERHVLGSTVNSEGYVQNVIRLFEDTPWLGVAFAPFMHVATVRWPNYHQHVTYILDELGIGSQVDRIPLAPQLGVFWFRPRALRKLFARSWEWGELDGYKGDGVLQSVSSIAMGSEYTVMEIMSKSVAQQSYLRLDLWAHEQDAQKTMRRAASDLLDATKRSMKFRFPRLFRALRPLYRMFHPAIHRLLR